MFTFCSVNGLCNSWDYKTTMRSSRFAKEEKIGAFYSRLFLLKRPWSRKKLIGRNSLSPLSEIRFSMLGFKSVSSSIRKSYKDSEKNLDKARWSNFIYRQIWELTKTSAKGQRPKARNPMQNSALDFRQTRVCVAFLKWFLLVKCPKFLFWKSYPRERKSESWIQELFRRERW